MSYFKFESFISDSREKASSPSHCPIVLQSSRNLKPPNVVPLHPPKLSPSASPGHSKQPLMPPIGYSTFTTGVTSHSYPPPLGSISKASYDRLQKNYPLPRRLGPTTSSLQRPAPPFSRPPGAALRVMPPKKRVKLDDDDDDDGSDTESKGNGKETAVKSEVKGHVKGIGHAEQLRKVSTDVKLDGYAKFQNA